jgi:hypothetical protein
MLTLLRSLDPPCPWDETAISSAARREDLDTLRWLRSQVPPCPWNASLCTKAATEGNLLMLQRLRSLDPPCPWDESVLRAAVDSPADNRWEILQWICSQDPPPWRSGEISSRCCFCNR